MKLPAIHLHIGRLTDMENVRIKLVRDYLLTYEETNEAIHVLTVRHGSRNTEELGLKKLYGQLFI